ncbi:MAG: hypothetical protein E7037_07665 [Verrucomicrobia bacterium]|nr:hypothetical protein [Verrucomicrobiota bacterium]
MLYSLLARKIGFLFFVLSAFPLFARAMEIKIHSDLPIAETGNSERVAIFNSRKSRKSEAKVWVTIEKKPIPRKEFILVEPPKAEWSHGNVWRVEEVFDDKGEIDQFSKLVVLDKASDWGKEDKFSATVTYYQVREHPLPPKRDGSPADNGPYFAGSDTKSLVVVAPEVSLESITFNHVPGNSDSDGIDLRKNYSGPDIIGPEWSLAGTQPVAYRAGVRPTVQVDFKIRPTRLNRVRAKAEESGMGLTWGISESWSTSSGGIFSGVAAVSPQIDKGDVSWKWAVTGFNGVPAYGWDDVRTTTVSVYKILGQPQSPWKEGAGTQKPWTDALDFAIEKCGTKGIKDPLRALYFATKYLHKKPYQEVSSCYYSKGLLESIFLYSDYMKNGRVNCFDSAYGLSLTSRLLGVPLVGIKHEPFVTSVAAFTLHCYTCYEDRIIFDSCSAIPEEFCLGLLKDVYLSSVEKKEFEFISEIYSYEIN